MLKFTKENNFVTNDSDSTVTKTVVGITIQEEWLYVQCFYSIVGCLPVTRSQLNHCTKFSAAVLSNESSNRNRGSLLSKSPRSLLHPLFLSKKSVLPGKVSET